MMTDRMINNRIQKLFDLESQKRLLESEIESLKTEIQSDMSDKGVESIDTGRFIVRWTPVSSTRIDSARLKKENISLFNQYSIESNYRRFSYSVH